MSRFLRFAITLKQMKWHLGCTTIKKKEAASTMMKMLFAAKTKAKVNIRSGSAKLDKFLRALCVGFQLIPALRILRWLGIALETFFFRLFCARSRFYCGLLCQLQHWINIDSFLFLELWNMDLRDWRIFQDNNSIESRTMGNSVTVSCWLTWRFHESHLGKLMLKVKRVN